MFSWVKWLLVGAIGALVVAAIAIALLCMSASVDAAGMMSVGTMMQGQRPSGAQSGHGIITESNSLITTEGGSPLRTE